MLKFAADRLYFWVLGDMGGERNPEREAQVRTLVRLAQANGLGAIAENASRAKVHALAGELLALQLSQEVQAQVQSAVDTYKASFRSAPGEGEVATVPDDPAQPCPAAPKQKTWKFSAVQLTYNSSQGDFASLDEVVLESLFGRFITFLQALARDLHGAGASATMERSSPVQVHLHAYLHLTQPFHRRGRDALLPFTFEGSHPHVTPNVASGKAYMGAVRFGHFYVVVDKIGTLLLGCYCCAVRGTWGKLRPKILLEILRFFWRSCGCRGEEAYPGAWSRGFGTWGLLNS